MIRPAPVLVCCRCRGAALVVKSLPDIARYLKIREM